MKQLVFGFARAPGYVPVSPAAGAALAINPTAHSPPTPGKLPPGTQHSPAQKMPRQPVQPEILQQLRAEPLLAGTKRPNQDKTTIPSCWPDDAVAWHGLAVPIGQLSAGGRIVDNIGLDNRPDRSRCNYEN